MKKLSSIICCVDGKESSNDDDDDDDDDDGADIVLGCGIVEDDEDVASWYLRSVDDDMMVEGARSWMRGMALSENSCCALGDADAAAADDDDESPNSISWNDDPWMHILLLY